MLHVLCSSKSLWFALGTCRNCSDAVSVFFGVRRNTTWVTELGGSGQSSMPEAFERAGQCHELKLVQGSEACARCPRIDIREVVHRSHQILR